MQRKILQLGSSSLVVSLPKSWINNNNLKKGELLNLNINNNAITYKSNIRKKLKTINLDLSKYGLIELKTIIIQHYRLGYDIIKVKYSSEEYYTNLESFILNKTLDFKISKVDSNTCIFKKSTEIDSVKLDIYFTKLFYIIKIETKEIYFELSNNLISKDSSKIRLKNRLNFDKYTNILKRNVMINSDPEA